MKTFRKRLRSLTAGALSAAMLLTGTAYTTVAADTDSASADTSSEPVITELPGTTSTESSFNSEFLSVTGFAKGYVNDRTDAIGTSRYRVVTTAGEFLEALEDAKTDAVDVIEIAADLDLGWDALSDEEHEYSCVNEYGWEIHADGTNNPYIEESGVSQITISNTKGLTIFSQGGCTVEHAEWKLQGTSSDIVIRNLKFDEMWRWSEAASSWDAGWTLLKINGAKGVWIDHCTFTLGADGNVDSENGAENITMSWCVQGLPTTETPGTDSMLYRVITYMEHCYKQETLEDDSRYKLLRDNGATKEQIIAYSAYHEGLNMNGSGESMFTDNFDSSGNNLEDGNYRIHITYAYEKVNNVGARFPLIRQGTAHLINCYVDDSGHYALHTDKSLPFGTYGNYGLFRGIDARDGACVGGDTCVFNQVTQPIVGAESQDDDYNGNAFSLAFSGVYNHTLLVNSKMIYKDQEYIGSSWDNNGDNLFYVERSDVWTDKSTIGNWKWFSSIDDRESYTPKVAPTAPFSFSYSDGPLPYSYLKLPLDEVEETVDKYTGAYTYRQDPEFWLKVDYDASEEYETADTLGEVKAESLSISSKQMDAFVGETHQLVAKVTPSCASETEVTWTSSDTDVAEVLDSGLVVVKKEGTATITATTKDGSKLSASCELDVSVPVDSVEITAPTKTLYLEDSAKVQLTASVEPGDATDKSVKWSTSSKKIVTVDENGVLTPVKAGTATITCTSNQNAEIKDKVQITVKEGTSPNGTTEPSEAPAEQPGEEPGETPSAEPTILYGDADGNGAVEANDALAVLRHVVRLTTLTGTNATAANVSADESITAQDALLILQKVVRLIDSFPAEKK